MPSWDDCFISALYCGWLPLAFSNSAAMNRFFGALTVQVYLSKFESTVNPFLLCWDIRAAALFLSRHFQKSVCVCVTFLCSKHSLPRDYHSFCSRLPKLLTQLLLTGKPCIWIDCVDICECLPVTGLQPYSLPKACLWILYLSLFIL